VVTVEGKLFQIRAAAAPKAQSPTVKRHLSQNQYVRKSSSIL